jgi:hypothetical protein
MDKLEVGDLVKDALNEGAGTYGLGVIVATESTGLTGEKWGRSEGPADREIPGKRYDVYFTQFERIITFHGDYLEKV